MDNHHNSAGACRRHFLTAGYSTPLTHVTLAIDAAFTTDSAGLQR
jgi:hypothetical protein